MSIKIREQERQHELPLSREGWLTVLAFLTENIDTAASDTQATAVADLTKAGREYVLSKEKSSEFKAILSREQCLDLFLFFSEFKEQLKESPVLESVKEGFKGFLLGGSE